MVLTFSEEPLEIIRPLKNMTIDEKETANFKCQVSKTNVKAKWFKDGKQLTAKDGYEIAVNKTIHTLSLDDVTVEDSGRYTIKVEDKESAANLVVEGTNQLYRLTLKLFGESVYM